VFDVLVPDGPLHPVDALWGLSAGLLVATVAARRAGRWLLLVAVAAGSVVLVRRGGELVDGYLDRPDAAFVVGLTAAVAVLTAVRPVRVSTSAFVAVAGCAGVWAIVPDTEVPLIVGAVLLGAAARLPRDAVVRPGGWLLLGPLVSAVVGSVGRPSRLGPALLVGVVLGGVAFLVVTLFRVIVSGRQRAGTPTTLAPGATSSVTTAPAPTTAF
jgi:hypothetical protein